MPNAEPSAGEREGLAPRKKDPSVRKHEGRAPLAKDVPLAAGRSRLDTLERRLGYAFRDRALLQRALTHKSAGADNFERFEFLGDAALGFVVGRMLFDALPDATEHRLTLMRASLVQGGNLATVAKDMDLGAFLELGVGERKSGVATRTSVLADALEAVLGAVVCDGGIECAEAVARQLFADQLAATADDDLKDPKTKLQEFLQSRHLDIPTYEVIDSAGPDHERLFTTVCRADSLGLQGEGTGRSRRESEKTAARAVLDQLDP